jgi:hypothetical protein
MRAYQVLADNPSGRVCRLFLLLVISFVVFYDPPNFCFSVVLHVIRRVYVKTRECHRYLSDNVLPTTAIFLCNHCNLE